MPDSTKSDGERNGAKTPPTGTLYLVGTPIGNLEDISLRALRILREVDLIACEDTRHTYRLLDHYGISTPRQSYHEHNEAVRSRQLVSLLNEGKRIALVSDAGMPLVSDPGYALVSACRRAGIDVTPVPGPSAAVLALAGSGLPTDSFLFVGFLPSRTSHRVRKLKELNLVDSTLVFFESPHRIVPALQDMAAILGPRRACLARELTKIHEEWLSGTLPEILGILKNRGGTQGEITLVVDRAQSPTRTAEYPASIREHLELQISRASSSRQEALKVIARERGISRREAYRLLLEEK
jgi:16S rRNA (cytidine1402-2'-O)-methyltransferase